MIIDQTTEAIAMKFNDSTEERFARLSAHIEEFAPEPINGRTDTPLPAIVMFHGCGGKRPHIRAYAEAAAKAGYRAFVVDSFAPRGWGRTFAITMICTGLVMQGYERSGDVLAVIWGLSQRKDVDGMVLLGESHGGWAISDLMTQGLKRPGEATLNDPNVALLDHVKGLYLIYPYLNFPARSNVAKWQHMIPTHTVIATKDHLTPRGHMERVLDRIEAQGVPMGRLRLEATHAFDEEDFNKGGIMYHDPLATKASIEGMIDFAKVVFNKTPAQTAPDTPVAEPAKVKVAQEAKDAETLP